jgi:hypothetical protein
VQLKVGEVKGLFLQKDETGAVSLHDSDASDVEQLGTPCGTVIGNRTISWSDYFGAKKLFGASCKTSASHFLTRPTAIFNNLSNY